MGKFRHALPRLHFGQATPAMLMQQDRDKPGLYRTIALTNAICHEYCSHTVFSRK